MVSLAGDPTHRWLTWGRVLSAASLASRALANLGIRMQGVKRCVFNLTRVGKPRGRVLSAASITSWQT